MKHTWPGHAIPNQPRSAHARLDLPSPLMQRGADDHRPNPRGERRDPLARALTIAARRSADAAERRAEVGALRLLISAHEQRLNRPDPIRA